MQPKIMSSHSFLRSDMAIFQCRQSSCESKTGKGFMSHRLRSRKAENQVRSAHHTRLGLRSDCSYAGSERSASRLPHIVSWSHDCRAMDATNANPDHALATGTAGTNAAEPATREEERTTQTSRREKRESNRRELLLTRPQVMSNKKCRS